MRISICCKALSERGYQCDGEEKFRAIIDDAFDQRRKLRQIANDAKGSPQ
jgi:hypothetical protein